MTKFKASANLVVVPVIVTDKSGKHISGLQKEAFRIEEDGKARSVSVFEETKTEKLVARGEAAASEGFSNFIAGDDRPERLTAIVLDMINTPSLKQLEAKKRLIDYLLRNVSADDPIAIYGLNSRGLHQIHSFTTDSKVLIDALKKLKMSLSSDERTQPAEESTDDPSEAKQALEEAMLLKDEMKDDYDTVSGTYQRTATRATLAGLTQLVHAFQAYPGRKTLVWASAGFPFVIDDPQFLGRQGDDLSNEYEEAWRMLNSANIAIYPVDLGEYDMGVGPLPSASSVDFDNSNPNIGRGSFGLKSALRLPYDAGSQQRLTLHAFADATGGKTCASLTDLAKCVAEAVDDSREYYLLGYYLAGDLKPGWRKLNVKVAGDAFRVRYKSGFYVVPEVQESAALRRKQFVDALASPVQYTGLRLTARLLQPTNTPTLAPSAGNKKHAEFLLGVMGDSIRIDRENGNAIDMEIIALAFDKNHQSVATASQAVATKLNPEMMRKTLQSGLGIPESLDLLPGKFEVKFAVRDNSSGLLGTVSVPIELK